MHKDPFGRVLAEPKPDPEILNIRNPFSLTDSVGMEGKNSRRDVAKAETLLGRLGEINLRETDGVTGFAGARLDESIRKFQKRHGLKVDGQINPGGETITTTGAVLAASEGDSDFPDNEEDKPERPLVPEQFGETLDQINRFPYRPRTRDQNEILVPTLKDSLKVLRKKHKRGA